MAGPDYGALGATFKITRLLQAISLITIIGMTANFVSEMVSANTTPPNILIGTLSVTSIAVLYTVLTSILFLDNILPFLLNAIFDTALLIALVIIAIIVGKPLSYLNCAVVGKVAGDASSAIDFATALASNLDKGVGKIKYGDFIGASKATCLEMKSIWGLSVALCILFSFSAICSICLWRRSKQLASASKDEEK